MAAGHDTERKRTVGRLSVLVPDLPDGVGTLLFRNLPAVNHTPFGTSQVHTSGPVEPDFSREEYTDRIAKTWRAMDERGLDLLVVSAAPTWRG